MTGGSNLNLNLTFLRLFRGGFGYHIRQRIPKAVIAPPESGFLRLQNSSRVFELYRIFTEGICFIMQDFMLCRLLFTILFRKKLIHRLHPEFLGLTNGSSVIISFTFLSQSKLIALDVKFKAIRLTLGSSSFYMSTQTGSCHT